VHTAQMLDEQVFTVEVVGLLWRGRGTGLRDAEIAAVCTEREVLGVEMALPFVLGRKGCWTAVREERARVCCLDFIDLFLPW